MPHLSPELLAVLRCPVTGAPLAVDGDDLVATVPGADGGIPRYRIEDGIPLLLAPEVLDSAAAAGSDQHDGTGTSVPRS